MNVVTLQQHFLKELLVRFTTTQNIMCLERGGGSCEEGLRSEICQRPMEFSCVLDVHTVDFHHDWVWKLGP